MKKLVEKIMTLTLMLAVIGATATIAASEVKAAVTNISVDGYYDDWEAMPYSWEYNWDNPYQINNYWDGTKNITKEYRDENGNPYNLEIRHKMSLYSDGKYAYVHVEIASNYNTAFNGDDYQFYVDGNMAAFRISYPGGSTITTSKDAIKQQKIYNVEVRHRNGSMSDMVVDGASAMYTRKVNDLNNELEVKIPLTALKDQNKNINIYNFNTIEFFTPNLMYRRISCSGASTGPYAGVVLCAFFAFGAVFIKKYKKRNSNVWQSF